MFKKKLTKEKVKKTDEAQCVVKDEEQVEARKVEENK